MPKIVICNVECSGMSTVVMKRIVDVVIAIFIIFSPTSTKS